MPNILTGLFPTIYRAMNNIARERIGYIPAVTINSSAAQAAVGETISYPIVPLRALEDVAYAMVSPNSGDETVGNGTMVIDNVKVYPIQWNGEEELGLANGGILGDTQQQQFEQAFRAIGNAVETSLANTVVNASRAHGVPGTAPFGVAGDLSDFAQEMVILDDNGAPDSDRHMVLSSPAYGNLTGKQSVLYKVNESGTEEMLRRGALGEVEGFMLHKSRAVRSHVKGTGAGYLVNNGAGYAIGATSIVIDTGTGTIIAGDVITFAGDSNKYVVTTGIAAPGTVVIAAPGLQQAVADNVAITIGNNYRANTALHRSAIHLVARAPRMPSQGSLALDVGEIADPVSGLVYQIAVFPGHRMGRIEIGLAWGVKAVKPEFVSLLLG